MRHFLLATLLIGCSGTPFASGLSQSPEGDGQAQIDSGNKDSQNPVSEDAGTPDSGGDPGSDAGPPDAGQGGASGSTGGGTTAAGGAPETGGASSGAGGSCSRQNCANDGRTCGEIDDGCGGTAKCLHECGSGEQCDAHACTCAAADVCPGTLPDGSQFWNACCTETGACGEDYGSGICAPVGSCTFVALSTKCPSTAHAEWACPGSTVGPDPSCTRHPAVNVGELAYYCCPKETYP